MFYTKIAVVFGEGKQFQSWIHVEDVSAIFLFILKNKLFGNFNAVAPNPITNLEMVNTTKNQLYEILKNKNFESFLGKWFFHTDRYGVKKNFLVFFLLKVPRQFFQFIFGEMHSILFSSQKVSSKKIQNSGYTFKHTNFDKAIINLEK